MTSVDKDNSKNVSLPLNKMVTWIGISFVAIVSGTFALTKLSVNSQISALEIQLEGLRSQEDDRQPLADSTPGFLPNVNTESISDPAVKELVTRISDLELERAVLLAEFADSSKDFFEPNSELANLISQLDSDDRRLRQDAATGLLALRDERSIPSMNMYIKKYPDESFTIGKVLITDWYDYLLEVSEENAILFVIDQLDSLDKIQGMLAYEYILEIKRVTFSESCVAQLRSTALNSSNTLTRTRAKLILAKFK